MRLVLDAKADPASKPDFRSSWADVAAESCG
jgi:hypothetical protein